MVSTHMRGAVSVAYSSTLEPDNILYLSDYQIIRLILYMI